MEALEEATRTLSAHDRTAAAMHLWELVGPKSNLQPAAARQYAYLLLWRVGDLEKALKILEPLAKGNKDQALLRTYAQALILNQRTAEGKEILDSLPDQAPQGQQAALSGALARTIEYYITDGEWESGEEAWETWQAKFPSDFLQGYSVLLRTKLMELKKAPEAAARVSEAFALAVPRSSYAPQLLDRASKLLAQSNPEKSKALRELLKQKYPEDPLSQESK